jgi:hypothetical protein
MLVVTTEDLLVQIGVTLLATALAFGSGYGLSQLNEYSKRKRSKKLVLGAIIQQSKEIKDALDKHVKRGKELETTVAEFREGHFNFRTLSLSTFAFDAALYSGVYHEFDTETQFKIVQIHEDIKSINNAEARFLQMLTGITDDVPTLYINNIISFYEKTLMVIEAEFVDSLPDFIKFLESKKQ